MLKSKFRCCKNFIDKCSATFFLPSSYPLTHVPFVGQSNFLDFFLHSLYGWTLVDWYHQLASICVELHSRFFSDVICTVSGPICLHFVPFCWKDFFPQHFCSMGHRIKKKYHDFGLPQALIWWRTFYYTSELASPGFSTNLKGK